MVKHLSKKLKAFFAAVENIFMKARELISRIHVERFDGPLGSKIFALSTIQSVDECPRVFIRMKDYLSTRPNGIVHFEDCVFKLSDFDRVAYIWYIWLIIIWSDLKGKLNVLIKSLPTSICWWTCPFRCAWILYSSLANLSLTCLWLFK